MNKIFKKILVLLTLLILPVFPVHSQEKERSFTIVPPTIEFRASPAESLETKVKVRNETDSPLTFKVVIRDFIVEDKLGTPKLLAPDTADNRWSASKWMMVSPDTFIVPAKSSFESMLYVQIPGNATYGGHYAAIVFEPAQEAETIEGAGATVITQTASLVYLQVLGPIKEQAQISKFSGPKFSEYGPINLETEINNLGDLHVKPVGTIEIKDIFGQTLESLALEKFNIFPGVIRQYTNTWQKKWLMGKFSANLALTYGSTNAPLSAVVTFFVFPYKIVLGLILAIIIIILSIKYFGKKKNPPPPEASR